MVTTANKISQAPLSQIKTDYPLTQEQINRYHRDGFVIIPGFFKAEEVEPLQDSLEKETSQYESREITHFDGVGKKYGILYWTQLGDSVLGIFPRLARIVDGIEVLSGEECYHWHSKIARKPPQSGRIEWHQGFGSWYYDGCVFPNMVTCSVAIGESTKENGCLQVIKGSHRLGRLDIVSIGNTVGTDPERLKIVLQQMEVVDCEMSPGDTIFFHSNTLHGSPPNKSDRTRSMIHCAYSGISNAPFIKEGQEHHKYSPIQKLSDTFLLEHQSMFVMENGVEVYRPNSGKDKPYMNINPYDQE
ncbi:MULTISPECIES: phytanoyl-CoA dioxygenase family protein [Spirulina sp. CCY15215]|uniref:phytanoyl-CoA dioxygenase family protein n=1 Tax=Spirulina sp. CCY15215 TaxID=2767591 RepID=UPI0019502AA8|nr:phytanoyl-CoA dioxygenase family protein [Spirulina major]